MPNPKDTSSPIRTTACRWLDLLGLGVASGSVWLLLAWRFPKIFISVIRAPDWVHCAGAGLVTLWCVYQWRGLVPLLGYKYFLRFPPLWVGAVWGLLISRAVYEVGPVAKNSLPALQLPYGSNSYGTFFCVVFGFVVLGALGNGVSIMITSVKNKRVNRRKAKKVGERELPPHQSTDPRSLMAWLTTDAPIENPDDDFFGGHTRIAERMVFRLLSGDGDASQAVVGPLGSGKTSLGRMVKSLLGKEPKAAHYRFVQQSLWGYETAEGAVESILDALLLALGKEVDCASLQSLPRRYLEAMTSAKGNWAILSHLLNREHQSLDDILRDFDARASALGLRFVLWIEDLERFASPHGSDLDLKGVALSSLRALLHHLDALPSVTVVMVTTELSETFDPEKIARYIEELPTLRPQESGPILFYFRKELLARHSGVILPPHQKNSHLGLAMDTWGEVQSLVLEASLEPSPIDQTLPSSLTFTFLSSALPHLAGTPRALKQALRRARESWDKYPGEINLEDLILMNLVRSASPEGFSLFRGHIQGLRESQESAFEFGKEPGPFGEALEKHFDSQEMRKALTTVAASIFSREATEGKLQGFKVNRPVGEDYWKRFLAEPVLEEADRDQPVLLAIQPDEDDGLCSCLERTDQGIMVLHFAGLIKENIAQGLLIKLVQRWAGSQDSPTLEQQGQALAYLSGLWGKKKDIDGWSPDDAISEIKKVFGEVLPKHPVLAALIQKHFLRGRGIPSPLNAGQAEECQRFLRAEVCNHYLSKPKILMSALEGAHPNTLRTLCLGPDPASEPTGDLGQEDCWTQLKNTVLAAVAQGPDIMLPQLAHLVFDAWTNPFSEGEKEGWRPNSRLTGLTHEEVKALNEVLHSNPTAGADDPAVRELRSAWRNTILTERKKGSEG